MSRVRVGARWAAAGEPLPSALVAPSVRQTAPPCTSAHCVSAHPCVHDRSLLDFVGGLINELAILGSATISKLEGGH